MNKMRGDIRFLLRDQPRVARRLAFALLQLLLLLLCVADQFSKGRPGSALVMVGVAAICGAWIWVVYDGARLAARSRRQRHHGT